MALIDQLRAEIAGRLLVTSTTSSNVGSTINVGDTFTARFSVRNTDPIVSFRNVKLKITGTQYASLVGASPQLFDLTPDLPPGQSRIVSVQFKALKTWMVFNPKVGVIDRVEPFATVEVRADADAASMLAGLVKIESESTDIELPGVGS